MKSFFSKSWKYIKGFFIGLFIVCLLVVIIFVFVINKKKSKQIMNLINLRKNDLKDLLKDINIRKDQLKDEEKKVDAEIDNVKKKIKENTKKLMEEELDIKLPIEMTDDEILKAFRDKRKDLFDDENK